MAPAHTLPDLSVDLMLEYIARGHGYAAHVMGVDESASMRGLNALTATHDRNGTYLGPNLGVETPDDLKDYMGKLLDDPQTRAFQDATGQITLYNPRDNVLATIGPYSRNGDFGTVHRYPSGPAKFEERLKDSTNAGNIRQFNNADAPGSVRGAANQLVSTMQKHPTVFQRNNNNDYRAILEEKPGVVTARNHANSAEPLVQGHSSAYSDPAEIAARNADNARLLATREFLGGGIDALKTAQGFVADLDKRGRPAQMFFLDEENARVIEVRRGEIIEHTFDNLPAGERAQFAETFFNNKIDDAAGKLGETGVQIRSGYDSVVAEYRQAAKPPHFARLDQIQANLERPGVFLNSALGYADDVSARMAILGFTDRAQLELFEAIPSTGADFSHIDDPQLKAVLERMAEAKETISIAEEADAADVRIEIQRFNQDFDALRANGSLEAAQTALRRGGLLEDAAQLTRGAIDAIRGLRVGARAAKLTKMGVITTVAGTTAAVAMTSAAHAQQRELAADILKAEFPFDQYEEGTPEYEAMRTRYEQALEEYRELNVNVERVMNTDAVGNQFLITIPFGIAATEKYAQSQFEAFSNRWNLSEDAHQALGMSMFDGHSLRGQFALETAALIPDTMSELPESLHGLWAKQQEMERAQSIYDARSRGRRMRPEQREAWNERKEAAREALAEAKLEYQREFEHVFADPESAREMLSRMPSEMLFEMVDTTARFNYEDAPAPINRMGELKAIIEENEVRLEELGNPWFSDEFSDERAERREAVADARAELESVSEAVRNDPEAIYEYIRNVYGATRPDAPLTAQFTQSVGSPNAVALATAFELLPDDQKNAVIADTAKLALDSEELRAVHPYIRELAELESRASRLPVESDSRYYNKHRHRIESQRDAIEERRAIVEEELRNHPEILAAAADQVEGVNGLIGQAAATQRAEAIEISVSEKMLDTYDGDTDLLQDAAAAGLDIEETLVAPPTKIPAAGVDSTVTFEAAQP